MKFEFRKGIKLALGEGKVNRQIAKLDAATRIVIQLHNISTAIHHIDATVTSKSSKKSAEPLWGVYDYANRLSKVILLG
jgi:hypothetical protein